MYSPLLPLKKKRGRQDFCARTAILFERKGAAAHRLPLHCAIDVDITCYIENSITALTLVYMDNSFPYGYKNYWLFPSSTPWLRPKSAISTPNPAPCQQSLFSLAPFWRTRERLLESRKIFVEHALHVALIRFQTNGTVGSVMTIGLSINGCSHSQISLMRENVIDSFRSSGCGDFKCLTRFSQSEPMNCASLNIHRLQVMIGLLADLSAFRLTRATTLVIGFTTLN